MTDASRALAGADRSYHLRMIASYLHGECDEETRSGRVFTCPATRAEPAAGRNRSYEPIDISPGSRSGLAPYR